jgi:TP901 family phage tail tape measure protein
VANEVNANIRVNLETADAAAQLKAFEAQISSVGQRIAQGNKKALQQQQAAISMFQSQVGGFGDFSTSIKNVETSVSRFTTSLEKGKLSFGEYFRYGAASTKRFGKFFGKELDTINAVAEDRVKRLSTRYLDLGKQAEGTRKLLAIRPTELTSGLDTQLAMTAQKQQIFNKLLQQGSTHLLNWGKNTQWAGRQLMVGFTIPLTIFGGMASKIFRELEKEAINFRKVYGDIFTTDAEIEANLDAVRGLASEFTKYGKTARETLELAATAAQAGQRGQQLIAATTEATRLSVLGDMNQQEAMKTTIALQSAFRLSTEQLTEAINFMNLVENSSVLTLEDMAGAIPRVAPVIQGLGGDVKEMSVLLVAMKEGGVSAAEGANGLKSSLGRLITPSRQAIDMADKFNISLEKIVETNRGDLLGTLVDLATQMEGLGDLEKQQLLSTIFGKFQFARMGALFDNLIRDGSQAQQVMEAMGMSAADLARTAEQELGAVEDSISTKFTAAVEQLKLAIAPIGEEFLRAVTPIIQGITGILEKFTSLPGGVKTAIVAMIGIIGGIAPVVLMGIGLIANGIANAFKLFNTIRGGYQRLVSGIIGANDPLSQSFGYMSEAELDAAAASNMLDQNLNTLNTTLLIQESSVNRLVDAYRNLAANMSKIGSVNPQGVAPPNVAARGFARGGEVPGKGDKDTEPALLTPGEFVVNKEAANRFRPILEAMNAGVIKQLSDGTPSSRVFVPRMEASAIPQSRRSPFEFGHSAGFSPAELSNTIKELKNTLESLKGSTDSADQALVGLLEGVLSAEKTLVNFEKGADGVWRATEQATVALSSLAEMSGPASMGQYAGGRITSGTRNEALKQIGVDEPITFDDLRMAADQAAVVLSDSTRIIGEPFRYALQGLIDQYHILENDGKEQSKYLLDNVQAMIRDQKMTDEKISASEALVQSLEARERIEQDLIATGAMVEGEIVDEARARQVVNAHLTKYAKAIATATGDITETGQIAKRAAMSQYSASGIGRIVQPKDEDSGQKIFATPATRTRVIQDLRDAGTVAGQEMGVYAAEGFGETFPGALEREAEEGGRRVRGAVERGTNSQSPPPWSIQIGQWIGEGITEGAQQSLRSLEEMTKKMRMEAEQGNIPGYIPPVPLSSRPGGPSDSPAEKAAKEQNAGAVKENTKLINQNNQQQVGLLTGLRKYTYAISGLTFALSYLPGNFQGLSQKIFAVTAAMNALDAVLRVDIIGKSFKKLSSAIDAIYFAQIGAAASKAAKAGKGGSAAAGLAGDAAVTAALLKGGGGAGGRGAGAIAARAASVAGYNKVMQQFIRFGAIIKSMTRPFAGLLNAVKSVGVAFWRVSNIIGTVALNFVRLGSLASKFAGATGIGLIITGLSLLVDALFVFRKYQDIGNNIKSLSDAAKLAASSLESLADKFSFSLRTTGFETAGTVLGRTEEARTVAQESRQFVSEDPGMQSSVKTIKEASDINAEAILRSMFMDILASGAPRDVAIGIVEAVANEAGKNKVFVPIFPELEGSFDDEGKIQDFATFIEQSLNPTIESVRQSLNQLSSEGLDQVFDQGAIENSRRWMAALDNFPDFMKKALIPQYEQKKAILETAQSFELLKTSTQNAMNFLSAEFVNGNIKTKKFNAGMAEIEKSLASLPNNQGLAVLKDQLMALYPESEANIESINDLDVAFQILSLQAQGVDMSGFVQQMGNAGVAADQLREKLIALAQAQANITSAESEIAKIQAKLDAERAKPGPKKGDPPKGGGSSSGGGQKDPFAERENKLRDEQASITIKEIKIDRKAEDMFANTLARRMGQTSITVGEIKIPLKSIADAEYAIAQIGERIEDIQRGPMRFWENAIKNIEKEIRPYQDRINAINRDIQLQQQQINAINREFKPILDGLAKQRQFHEDILNSLRDQLRAATEPIQDRIDALKMEQRTAERAAKPRLKALEQEEKQMEKQKEALDNQIESIEKQKDVLDEQISNIDRQREALSKVQKINEAMVRQQQQMVNLSKAIAEGDIYAATQAAQEMRADAARQAVEGQQDAFDSQKKSIEDEKKVLDDRRKAIEEEKKAYENRKKAIDEEREAIRERIDAIGEEVEELEYQKALIEDSYKFRIREQERLIEGINREIERTERARDARIEPYQKIIDDYAPELEDLENFIYDKEKEIEKIRRDQLEPLQDIIDELTDEKDILEDILGDIELSIKRQKQQLAQRKKYLDQELQILAAKREMANLDSGGGGGGGGGSAGTEGTRDEDLIKKLEADLKKQKDILAAAREDLRKLAIPFDLEQGDSWWQNILNGIQRLAGPLSGLGSLIDKHIIKPFTDFASNIWENFVFPVIKALGAVGAAIGRIIGRVFSRVWEDIKSNFGRIGAIVIGALASFFGPIFEGIRDAIAPIWDKIVENVIEPLQEFATTISEWFEKVMDKIEEILSGIGEWFETSVIQPISAAWETFLNWTKKPFDEMVSDVEGYLNRIITWFTNLPGKIGSFITVSIPAFFSTMWGTEESGVYGWINKILTFFAELPGKILNFITVEIVGLFQTMWGTETTGVYGWINKILTWFKELPDKVEKSILDPIIEIFENIWGDEEEGVYGWINKILTFFKELPETIREFIVDNIISLFEEMWGNEEEGVYGWIIKVQQFFEDLPNNIKTFVVDKITGLFRELWGDENKGIYSWLNKIYEFFRDLPGKIGGFIADIGRRVAAALNPLSVIGIGPGGSFAGGEVQKAFMGGEIRRPMGGLIPYSFGGSVTGDGGRDSTMAMLTPGEFVIRKSMVDKYGIPMLKSINQGAFQMPSYNMPRGGSDVGATSVNNVTSVNAPVYNNYNMDFQISGANANADEIANRVMVKMKQIQNQQIRSGRAY